MKNIYIFDEYSSSLKNGIGTYLHELLYCLKSLNYNICLIVFDAPTDEFNIIKENGIKKILFPPLKSYFLLQIQIIEKFIRLYIEDSCYNVFFLNHSPCGELFGTLKVNFPLSKFIFVIHDFGWTAAFMGDLENYKNFINKLDADKQNGQIIKRIAAMYNTADKVICLSKDTFSVLSNLYEVNKSKLALIPNGIRNISCYRSKIKAKIKEDLRLHLEDKVLLFIGRPTKQKGLYDLLIAMNKVLNYYPNTKLVIIGNSEEEILKEMIKVSSKNAASVIYTGQLDKKALERWMAVADIGVIPSYYEQCTYAGIEMMRHGFPVIASDGFGIRCMFIDGINAKIAKIGDRKHSEIYQNNLSKSIIELLQSPELCDILRKGALKTYQSVYSIKRMREQYQKLIENL